MNQMFQIFFPTLLLIPLGLPEMQSNASVDLTIASEATATNAAADLESLLDDRLALLEGSLDQEAHCLAQAVYFEARSEPLDGQLAVAQVVLTRVKSKRYPNTVCKVVFQNEHRRNRCQFSFACDGRSDQPRNRHAWSTAQRIGYVATSGLWQDLTGDATHYHATYVTPYWKDAMYRTAQHGLHTFYRETEL